MERLTQHPALSSIIKEEISTNVVPHADTSSSSAASTADNDDAAGQEGTRPPVKQRQEAGSDTSPTSSSTDDSSAGAFRGFSNMFRGFGQAIPKKLTTSERGYLSPNSNEEFHSAETSPQDQSHPKTPQKQNSTSQSPPTTTAAVAAPGYTTPEKSATAPPPHPLPKQKSRSLKHSIRTLDKKTTDLAEKIWGIPISIPEKPSKRRKEPLVVILEPTGDPKYCSFCDNSRYLTLAPPVRASLRCNCERRVWNGPNPPLLPPETSPPPPPPSPTVPTEPRRRGPVTRNKGVPSGTWDKRTQTFIKNPPE